MPELERFVLHRLWELDALVRRAYDDFDFHALFTALHNFCAVELSAFYFDMRKDSLYCDRHDAPRRRAARTAMDRALFDCLTAWLAPILCFTAEEAWLARNPGEGESVHLRTFPTDPVRLARRRARGEVAPRARHASRRHRRAGEGARRQEDRIEPGGAADSVRRRRRARGRLGRDLHHLRHRGPAGSSSPAGAETLPGLPGVGVVFATAAGAKCARCWKVLPEVGTVPPIRSCASAAPTRSTMRSPRRSSGAFFP